MVKVVELPNQNCEFVVQILRDALADAEAGNIASCLLLTSKPGGAVQVAWGGELSFHEKIGMIELMKHRMFDAAELVDDCEHTDG